MNKKIVVLLSIVLIGFNLQAQVAMGKWRTHFAYNTVSQIAQSQNKVYAVSEGVLFSVDKRDGGMEFYSKLTGLNGTSISKIEFDQTNKILLIIYQDGNIDFMSENGVKNLPDFYNKQMSANKGVNHILFMNNMALLSCNFGIITLNMLKMEIKDTYYIGANASEVKVLNTALHGGNIYATTPTDIYYAPAAEPNLINYEYWKKMGGLPGSGEYQALASFGDWLILLRGGKLYKQSSTAGWSALETTLNYSGILVSDGYLQAYTDATTNIYNSQLAQSTLTGLNFIKNGLYDTEYNEFWFAGDPKGVARYKSGTPPVINYYKPDGPSVNIPYRMQFAGQKLFVVPGEKWVGPAYRPGDIMIYENNVWKNILNTTIEQSLSNIRVEDFSAIAIDPDDNKHFYATSASTGIYEFKNEEFFKHYDRTNSPIESALNITDYYYQWTDNGILDKDKNLWMTNDLVSYGIKVLKSNGEWVKLDYSGVRGKQSLGQILISNQNPNQKWVLSRRHIPGICIFDDNGTIDKQSDDKSVFHPTFNFNSGEGITTITPAFFFCMEQEKNGTIWVGTNEGPLLFNNPSKAFDSDFACSRVKIPRNDGTISADYLLVEEQINAIAIDGANRKWLGTKSSGIYLMSENGQETIRHFTTMNSPLLSNEILSIAINPVTGEVFIGTGAGLVSYQSDAAEDTGVFNNVHAYPNPVRENYSGIITITGLVADTKVKITDLTGNVVCETTSNGSIATWDGKNTFGQKVSTGVYLAICVTPDGLQSAITKILVIN